MGGAGLPRGALSGELPLSGVRKESGETDEECAHRELREEAGITAESWLTLGSYVISLDWAARVHLFEARDLSFGPQGLTLVGSAPCCGRRRGVEGMAGTVTAFADQVCCRSITPCRIATAGL